jgi:signal peptidase I
VNREVARRSTDVTAPAPPAPDATDASETPAASPAPAVPDEIGDPARPDRAGAHRAGAGRHAADPAARGQVGANREGVHPDGAERDAPVAPRARAGAGRADGPRAHPGVRGPHLRHPERLDGDHTAGCPGCDNDRVLVDKLAFRFGAPAPGDIVVFTRVAQLGSLFGIHAADETEYIKRVIAVGGQTVACCDERNRIIVDGVAVDEPYIYFLPGAGRSQQKPFGPVRVPEGELWAMGDSRNDSVDSRSDGNGPVPVADVIGKARFIVYPFDRLGAIPAPPSG